MEKSLIDKNNSHIIVIFLGLFLSIVLSTYYVLKYDKYILDSHKHQIIKDETRYHWFEGAKIAKDVREGKNFFLSGDTPYTKPLPQRIVGLYSLITGYELVDKWDHSVPRISLEGKIPYLILQALFYFFAVYYFSKRIIKIVPKRAFLFIILFLCLEPTIFQYHSSFWTESIYFSLHLIVLGMLFEKKLKFSYNFFIGILIGFSFLQRSVSIFYIVPVLLCYTFLFRQNFLKPFLGILSGYAIICIIIGSFNHHKTQIFSIMPPEGKWGLYTYFSVYVLADKLNISPQEARVIEADKSLQWLKANNIKLIQVDGISLDVISSGNSASSLILDEKERYKFYDYISHRQYEILLDSPLITIKHIIKATMHFLVLDPTFNYYYNTYRGLDPEAVEFFLSKTHKNLIPFRISYTLIVYFFCFMGAVALYKKKKFYEFYLITLSVLYHVVLFGWYGKTRIFVPSLIYLSIFFGIGVDLLLNKFKQKIK